jgi:hypothetical protein
MSRLEERLVCERFALNDKGLIDDDVEYCETVNFYVGFAIGTIHTYGHIEMAAILDERRS